MTKNKVVYIFGLLIITVIIATTAVSVASMLNANKNSEKSNIKYITAEDDVTTLFLKKGEKMNLELKDYGDGGYSWDITKLDETVLSFTDRTDNEPSGLMGDFGNDIWIFTAENAGLTTLELKCVRPWDNTDVCATFAIEVEVQ